jgi:hypothetical protein
MLEENRERCRDELEALRSIYAADDDDDSSAQNNNGDVAITAQPTAAADDTILHWRLTLRNATREPLIVNLQLPLKTYPAAAFPEKDVRYRTSTTATLCNLKAPWLTPAAATTLRAAVDDELADAGVDAGGECVYTLIEALRTHCVVPTDMSPHLRQQTAAVAAAAAVATAAASLAAVSLSEPGVTTKTTTTTINNTPKSNANITNNNNNNNNNVVVEPAFTSGEPLTDRKSTFVAHAAAITDTRQVPLILQRLLSNSKIARATHPVMYAYRLEKRDAVTGNVVLHADNDDDGEHGAGTKLAHLLALRKVTGALVVVTRWYGGILLGPDRFKHIARTASLILDATGLSGSG